jgi:flagellar motor switch protein FliG
MSEKELTPSEKSALILLSLGKDVATQVLQHLSEAEIKKISRAFVTVTEIERELQFQICREFQQLLKAGERLLVDGREFAKDIITNAFGDGEENTFLDFMTGTRKEPLSTLLAEVPDRALKPFISAEHPQTIAFLLTKMNHEQAASVLQNLTEEQQTDILVRISHLTNVRSEVLDEVREVLRSSLKGTTSSDEDEVFGPKSAADILNFVERNNEERILSEMEEMYPDITEQIRNLMFTFEDLQKIDDKGIQVILKETARDQLVLSLKTASPELSELILRNMSQRAAAMIQEELETLGPVKLKDVEKAQQGVIDLVKRLEGEGKIMISGSGADDQLV